MVMRGSPSLSTLVALLACAMVLGAWAAPASAATVFCKTNVETCSAENTYPLGSEFSFSTSGTTVILETVASKFKCPSSTIGMKSEKSEGGPLLGEVTSVTFGKCSVEAGFGECKSLEVRNLPWSAKWIAGTGGGEDKMSLGDSGKGRPAIRLLCFGFSCTYGVAELSEIGMPVISGKTHVVLTNRALALFEGSPLCATVLTWSADYNSPAPEALFLTF
jgi:hypothetical protein